MSEINKSGVIVEIQYLRALAALSVVFLHILHESGKLGGAILNPLSALPFGAGVDLFFLISGFVMFISAKPLFSKSGAGFIFLRKRLFRLVPVYWAGSFLFLVSLYLFPSSVNSNKPDFVEVVYSIFFIPYRNFAGDIQPVLKLGWTLNYEIFFYSVLSFFIFLRPKSAIFSITLLFLGLVFVNTFLIEDVFIPIKFWSDPIIIEFIIGSWIGFLYLRSIRLSAFWPPVLAGIGVFLLFWSCKFNYIGSFSRLVLWGIPMAFILASVLWWPNNKKTEKCTFLQSFFMLIGEASYALYVFHPFTMRFFKELWSRLFDPSLFSALAYVLVSISGSVLISIIIHLKFEKPFTRWLNVRFQGKKNTV